MRNLRWCIARVMHPGVYDHFPTLFIIIVSYHIMNSSLFFRFPYSSFFFLFSPLFFITKHAFNTIIFIVFLFQLSSMLLTSSSINSPEKLRLKPSPRKKQGKKTSRERDLYRKNYFFACESLLSVLLNRQRGKSAVLCLKKSGPELSALLTQFSAGIAGTGIAVIFSVMCKIAGGRVPFCASRLLDTGFGFGLVWLSGAFNKLRETVVYVTKNSSKAVLNEDEAVQKVNKSVDEIFFRAAALMVVAALRFV